MLNIVLDGCGGHPPLQSIPRIHQVDTVSLSISFQQAESRFVIGHLGTVRIRCRRFADVRQ